MYLNTNFNLYDVRNWLRNDLSGQVGGRDDVRMSVSELQHEPGFSVTCFMAFFTFCMYLKYSIAGSYKHRRTLIAFFKNKRSYFIFWPLP